MIIQINNEYYNRAEAIYDAIPFSSLLPSLLEKYATGKNILEIGSGGGALASWLTKKGYDVECLEPAQKLAKQAEAKGLKVNVTTIQQFGTERLYDNIVAISSLIHVPKKDLPFQIQKIARFCQPKGMFFVSLIEGEGENLEDPSKEGKMRFFSKWSEKELDSLFSPHFELIESHKHHKKSMDYTFFLRVYQKVPSLHE